MKQTQSALLKCMIYGSITAATYSLNGQTITVFSILSLILLYDIDLLANTYY